MTHPGEARLDAWLDGELSPAEAREVETHVAACAECRRFRDGRLALRAAITSQVPALQAPDVLRQRVRSHVKSAGAGRFRAVLAWRALAMAASVAVVAFGGWQLGVQRGRGEALADAVLTSHIRSLMPGHLTDVQSSDQHTVKPWFNGKLDYSPPVYDFAGKGYPLLGGRLDYVGGRQVAALAYGRRQHIITVCLWPKDRESGGGPAVRTHQGYHLLRWTSADYAYWAVSDLGLAELEDFQRLMQQADSAAIIR